MQKTAYELRISDWSSDVCSSDLTAITGNVNCGIQALLGPPTLFELEKPHQRLRAAEIEWLAVEPIPILKSQIVQHHSWAFHHSAGMWHRNADRISFPSLRSLRTQSSREAPNLRPAPPPGAGGRINPSQ